MHVVRGPRVPASPGYHFLVARRALTEIVRHERPHVIEVGSPYLAPWLARRAAHGAGRRARLVAFAHENPLYYLRRAVQPLRWVGEPLVRRYLAAAHRDFDLAVAASPANLEGLGVANGVAVPLGVDAALFDPARRDAAWRAEVGAAPGQPVALYVGRLSAEKRLDVVLGALPALHRATGLRLVLIGEGHLRRALERAARAQPERLAVLPFESDRARLARAYASADLAFAPCPFETFGLAAVEAMASGLPLVGVAAAGVGRLLEGARDAGDARDSDWARTYRVGDAADCERAVRELLSLDLRAAGRRARAVAVERYGGGWDRTFSALLALYQDLAASAARAASTAPSPAGRRSV